MNFKKNAHRLATSPQIWFGYDGRTGTDPFAVKAALDAALEHNTIEEITTMIGEPAVDRFRRRHAQDEHAPPDEIVAWWTELDNAEDAMDALMGQMFEYNETGTTGVVDGTDLAGGSLLSRSGKTSMPAYSSPPGHR